MLVLPECGVSLLSFLNNQDFKLGNLILATEILATRLQKKKEKK